VYPRIHQTGIGLVGELLAVSGWSLKMEFFYEWLELTEEQKVILAHWDQYKKNRYVYGRELTISNSLEALGLSFKGMLNEVVDINIRICKHVLEQCFESREDLLAHRLKVTPTIDYSQKNIDLMELKLGDTSIEDKPSFIRRTGDKIQIVWSTSLPNLGGTLHRCHRPRENGPAYVEMYSNYKNKIFVKGSHQENGLRVEPLHKDWKKHCRANNHWLRLLG
jgi:hypothetical protein